MSYSCEHSLRVYCLSFPTVISDTGIYRGHAVKTQWTYCTVSTRRYEKV